MYKIISFILFLIFHPTTSFATNNEQSRQVTGTVTDSREGFGLPGVNVSIPGTSSGTVTDHDGFFELTVPEETVVLRFSYIGYQTKELTVTDQTTLTVELSEDLQRLSEIVVTGYTTQRRETLTSSISSISADQIPDIPAASADQLLQGLASGVQVSSSSGAPGGGIFVSVRGSTSINAGNDPLYIVDGVPISNTQTSSLALGGQVVNPLADLNPSDIESIDILKDANATAIYGARGANGVVVITTRRGQPNTPSLVRFGTSVAYSWAPNKFEVVTGDQDAMLQNEVHINNGGSFESRPFRPVSEGGRGLPEDQPTYDRISDLFQVAPSRNYELSVAGGSENTRYFIGGDLSDQEGIVKPASFGRFSGRFNFDHIVNDFLSIGTSTTVSRTTRNISRSNDTAQGVINSAIFVPAYQPIFNEDGSYAKYGIFDNHLALINERDRYNVTGLRLISNVYAELEILPGLSLRSNWSVDYGDNLDETYNSTQLVSGQPQGVANTTNTRNYSWINEQILTWRTNIGENHNLTGIIGNTLQEISFERSSLTGRNFPGDDFRRIASSSLQTGSSSGTKSGLASFFTNWNYIYKDRYIFDVNFRADASSRFGADNRWGYFPAAGIAWRISQEEFLRNVDFINELKLSANIGITGNQSGINDFASLGLWSGGNNYLEAPGTTPVQMGNPNLRWETTTQWDVGLDLAVLNERLGLELNVYSKYTEGLLLNVPVPNKLGFDFITQNEGEMSNRGIEFSLNSTNISSTRFQWTTSFNIARNVNIIERLPSPITRHSRDWIRMEEGYSMYSFWVYRQLEVDPQTGDAIYEDVNGDGQITVADRQIAGNALPDFFGGINNRFSYLGFDLGVLFNFEYGNKVYNLNRFFMEHGGIYSGSITFLPGQLDRWQQPGDITDIPRMTTQGNNYTLPSDRNLEDASFLRLRSLSLGYTLPLNVVQSIGLQSLRVYFQGTNLWTLTRYSGLDPEVNSADSISNVRGIDQAVVPNPRTVQFGVNLSF
ncbi:MAG: TonB-dependent receptor [Balneolaceae bacterium]|nr:TonB-dependent receptor [Balneolaceae bacterium]